MRRFLFVLPVIIALGCDSGTAPAGGGGGGDKKGGGGGDTKTPDKPAASFKVDAWSSWNAVGVGSSIVLEMDAAGNKMVYTKTLDKKGDPEHTLKVEGKMGDTALPASEEKVAKLKDTPATGTKCGLCGKDGCTANNPKWSKEKVKVGDKDVECDVMEMPEKNCKGEASAAKSKMWFSNDVPGQMVKMESEAGGMKTKMWISKFEKK